MIMLRSTDLMVGDWVNYQYNDEHIKPAKVTGLWENGMIELTFTNGMCVVTNIIYVMPIPITPEILEKNGWEERPTGHVFYTDGKRYDNSLWYIFGSNTFVVNNAEFQINYVHELQHALKLCGFEKEIIL